MTDFFAYPFFQRALVAGLLTALLCGALSFFVILRRLAFVGTGVAHAAFGGVAVAALLGAPTPLGGAAAALAVAWATSRSSGGSSVSEDTAVGVFTVAAMAAGVVAIGFLKTNVDLFGLMFGNILTASAADVWLLAAATCAILLLLAWYFRPLLLSSIDDEGAEANGVDVRRMRLLVLSLVGMAVVVALKVVGILLVSALLVLPGAIARPLTDRWPGFLAGSVGAAVTMLLGGLVLSVSVDIAPGAAIILVGTGLFLGSLAIKRFRS